MMKPDLAKRLASVDVLETPELWDLIQRRAAGASFHRGNFETERSGSRVVAATVALAVAALAVWMTVIAFRAPEPTTEPATPIREAVNGRIAFTKRLSDRWNLFTVNPDGSDEQQVTSGVRDYFSAWSPDGTKLAVDTEQGITIMDADGSHAVTIASTGKGSAPAWSPDGTRILYTKVDQDGPYVRIGEGSSVLASHIFASNIDGSGEEQLTTGPYSDFGGSWSPDGSQIVFARGSAGDTGLYVMDADGSGLTRISDSRDTDPGWSPDGSQIVFSRWTSDEASIFVTSIDGSNGKELTSGSKTFDTSPIWSPDGSKIAFTRELVAPGDDGGHIYVMSADGGDVSRLTEGSEEEQAPSWGTAPPTSG
jgi:Tol biopolymer transport system component